MRGEVFKCLGGALNFILIFLSICDGQRRASLPLSPESFRQIVRTKVLVPKGKTTNMNNIIVRLYGTNTTERTSYRVTDIKRLLSDPNFDARKPTVLYVHGYIELTSDDSVMTVVRAYIKNGGYNILVLDWANLAFGNYFTASISLQAAGAETGKAIWKLLKGSLSLEGLHLVGHSLGVHLAAVIARALSVRGYKVPRLTGLDPAYPGFYPPLLGPSVLPSDAEFVDIIHTDGGGFGGPEHTGHADFWPNEGQAKQPGCLSATVPFTVEDFCSHWRSWKFWAESVTGGEFLSQQCETYDSFLRGLCHDSPLVYMGLRASPQLRGNYYLRTAAKEPFALGERGAQ